MGVYDCQHLPLSKEIWLLLAVISNANGSIILSSRSFDFPSSWFATMALIHAFRFIFKIKTAMPIILDAGSSLFLQWIICSTGEFGWRWAFSLAYLFNIWIFHKSFVSDHLDAYVTREKLMHEPNPRPPNVLSPICPMFLGAAVFDVYILNAFFMFVAWFYPWNDGFYQFLRDYIGYVLVFEGYVFWLCYKDLISAKNKDSMTSSLGCICRRHRSAMKTKSLSPPAKEACRRGNPNTTCNQVDQKAATGKKICEINDVKDQSTS